MEFFVNIVKGKFLLFLIVHLVFFYGIKYCLGVQFPALATNTTMFMYPFMVSLAMVVLSAGYSMPKLSDSILKRNDISYDIYVFHLPIAGFFIEIMGTGIKSCITAMILTFIVSIISYKYIDKNISKLKTKSLRS